MYLDYHHLSQNPFSVSPDPDFLFMSPSHKEALGSLLFCVENRLGFVVLTGEVGTGKTTIIRYYLENCNRERTVPVYIFNPGLTFPELLRTILEELGDTPSEHEGPVLFRALQKRLLAHAEAGRTVSLLIDEAQNIPMETLEQLRMLSNFETSREKLLQIILIGQPELERLLNREGLRQLRQRIAVRAVITHLTPAETRAYIEHRTTIAGGDVAKLFSEKGLKAIIRHAQGAPRTINILCANALIACVGYGRRRVDEKIVNEVVLDLGMGRTSWSKFSPLRFALASILMVLLGGASAYVVHNRIIEPISILPGESRASSPSVPPPTVEENLFAGTSKRAPDNLRTEESPIHKKRTVRVTKAVTLQPRAPAAANRSMIRPGPGLASQVTRPVQKIGSASRFITRKVERGDYLSKMSIEVYGEVTESTLSRLRYANPQIADPNLIYEGDVLLFPK